MTKRNGIPFALPAVDDLFTTQEERDLRQQEHIRELPLSDIHDFPGHPFQVRMDEAMEEMAGSIREYGVLVPVLVRPREDGSYEMVAGHRRKRASELAGRTKLPCIVRSLTDDEAILVMVDSNLQRETILPSEKAFAYKMKLEAMKRQGQRTDLTSATLLQKSEKKTSRQILAEQTGESHEQIRKYIRLTHLIPPLLERVDAGTMALRPAVELSYLTEKQQEMLLEAMELEDCSPSHVQAIKLRHLAEEGKLDEGTIGALLAEQKPNQKEQLKIPQERIRKYFPKGTSRKQMEETIVKALEWYRKRERSRER